MFTANEIIGLICLFIGTALALKLIYSYGKPKEKKPDPLQCPPEKCRPEAPLFIPLKKFEPQRIRAEVKFDDRTDYTPIKAGDRQAYAVRMAIRDLLLSAEEYVEKTTIGNGHEIRIELELIVLKKIEPTHQKVFNPPVPPEVSARNIA